MNSGKNLTEQLEDWRTLFFDERQRKEIALDVIYAHFSHDTECHNARLIIAKMAELLDKISAAAKLVQGG